MGIGDLTITVTSLRRDYTIKVINTLITLHVVCTKGHLMAGQWRISSTFTHVAWNNYTKSTNSAFPRCLHVQTSQSEQIAPAMMKRIRNEQEPKAVFTKACGKRGCGLAYPAWLPLPTEHGFCRAALQQTEILQARAQLTATCAPTRAAIFTHPSPHFSPDHTCDGVCFHW